MHTFFLDKLSPEAELFDSGSVWKSGEFASNCLDDREISMLSLHHGSGVLKDDDWLKQLTTENYRSMTSLFYGHVEPYGTLKLDMNPETCIT